MLRKSRKKSRASETCSIRLGAVKKENKGRQIFLKDNLKETHFLPSLQPSKEPAPWAFLLSNKMLETQ